MSEKLKNKIGEDLYKQLLEKGLESKDIDIVTDGSWIPKSRFNEVNDKYKETTSKISTYESQLKDTKKLLETSEDFKTKYTELEQKYSNDLKSKDTEISNISKRYAVESSLLKEGAKYTDLLLKDIDFDTLSFDKNNTVLGIDNEIERLKKERSDFFPKTQSSSNGNPSLNNSNNSKDDDGIDWKAEFDKIKI